MEHQVYSFLKTLLCGLVLVFALGNMSRAENEDTSRYPHLQIEQLRSQQKQLNVRPVRPQGGNMLMLGEQTAAPRRTIPVAPIEKAPVIQAKINPTTFIAVLGDSFGDLLAQGIDEAYGERTDVMILRKARADSGLVRSDFYDWPKSVKEILSVSPKPTFAVMMIGTNDRQQIRDGDVMVEPLSDRWKDLYRERIKAVIKLFDDHKVPVVWVGLPPMKNDRLSADLAVLNTLFKDVLQTTQGGVGGFVDLWQPFADPDNENEFTATGPDINGKIVRMRTPDGVHLTAQGARKAAHFVDAELKRLMERSVPVAAPASLSPDSSKGENFPPAAGVAASLPLVEALEPTRVQRLRPAIGSTFSLTTSDISRDGSLMPVIIPSQRTIQSRVDAQNFTSNHKANIEGRADDFRWPKQN